MKESIYYGKEMGGLKLFDSFDPSSLSHYKKKSLALDMGPHFVCAFMAQSKANFAPPGPHQIYKING